MMSSRTLMGICAAVFLCGCEVVDKDTVEADDKPANTTATPTGEQAATTTPTETTTTAAASTTAGDALDPSSVAWLGTSYANASSTKTLYSSTVSQETITMSYESLDGWPGGETDAIVCFFYIRAGTVTGGKFDWKRPGQTSKGTENIHGGYGGHSMPADGTDSWLMLVSTDGKQRSNTVKCNWD